MSREIIWKGRGIQKDVTAKEYLWLLTQIHEIPTLEEIMESMEEE